MTTGKDKHHSHSHAHTLTRSHTELDAMGAAPQRHSDSFAEQQVDHWKERRAALNSKVSVSVVRAGGESGIHTWLTAQQRLALLRVQKAWASRRKAVLSMVHFKEVNSKIICDQYADLPTSLLKKKKTQVLLDFSINPTEDPQCNNGHHNVNRNRLKTA